MLTMIYRRVYSQIFLPVLGVFLREMRCSHSQLLHLQATLQGGPVAAAQAPGLSLLVIGSVCRVWAR